MGGNKRKDDAQKKRVTGFQVLESECIWMKAGVVNFHQCNNAYDCYTCLFDRAMRRAMGEKEPSRKGPDPSGWATPLDRKQGSERLCRHSLSGRIEAPKTCPLNYECYHCHFDQILDDTQLGQPEGTPAYTPASGFQLAEGYYYHMGHAWARIEHGGRVRVGLDDFASRVFGPPESIDLPPLGTEMDQGHVAWAFARNGRSARCLSPVTGTVLAVNQRAAEQPLSAHKDPYGAGWLFIVEPGLLKENLKGLFFGGETAQWIETETRRLMTLFGPEYGQLAATGAKAVDDLLGRYPEIGWERLVGAVLRT